MFLPPGPIQRIVVQTNDPDNLPYSITVPKLWLRQGKWPTAVGGVNNLMFACGKANSIMLSLRADPKSSVQSVLSSFAKARQFHPSEYFALKGGAMQGCMMVIPVPGGTGREHAPKDYIAGRLYEGSHKVLFFQYVLVDHKATAADRQLVANLVLSLKPR